MFAFRILIILILFSGTLYADGVLYYFYSSGCKKCKKVDPVIDKLFQKKDITGKILSGYSEKFQIEIEKLNIDNRKYSEFLMYYAKAYNIPFEKRMVTPVVFYGKGYLIGDKAIRNSLGELIKKNQAVVPPAINVAEGKQNILDTYQAISLATIMGAGLLDGINPCTITALIFFLSLLALTKDRRKMVYTAGAFISANYIAYFLIGAGLLKGISYLTGFKAARQGLYSAGAVFSMVMAGINIKDSYTARKGDIEEITAKLPDRLRVFGKRLLKSQDPRAKSNPLAIIIGAFIAGCAIAGIEFICTGQVYLPSIIYMTKIPGYKLGAMGKLGLYNFMVIFPQIILACLVIAGAGIMGLSDKYKKNIAGVKLAMAVFFILIGGYMVKNLFL